MEVAMDRDRQLVDGDHLDHAAASGDRPQRVGFAAAGQGQAVGVGVGIADVDRGKGHAATSLAEGCLGSWQPGVAGLPPKQATEEAHVGALRGMGGGERTGPIKLDEDGLGQAANQIAGQPADP